MGSILGDKNEVIVWYLHTHAHSMYRSMGNLASTARKTGNQTLILAVRGSIDKFDNAITGFKSTDDVESQYALLMNSISNIPEIVAQGEFDADTQSQLELILEVTNDGLNQVKQVIDNPLHEEPEILYNLLINSYNRAFDSFGDKFSLDKGTINDVDMDINSNIDEEPPKHTCVAYDMYALFHNIFCNALDAMDKGNIRVFLDHKRDKGYATISIENDGSFITEDNLKKIISREQFTTKPDGHGDGLKIVYDILDKYQGTMRVESDHTKKITRFEFDLKYNRNSS